MCTHGHMSDSWIGIHSFVRGFGKIHSWLGKNLRGVLLIPEGAFSFFLTSDRRCMVEFFWASQHPPYIVQVVTPSFTLTPSLTTLTSSLVTGRQGEEKQNSKSWYGSKSRYNYTTDKRSGTERHRRWQEGNGSMLF